MTLAIIYEEACDFFDWITREVGNAYQMNHRVNEIREQLAVKK